MSPRLLDLFCGAGGAAVGYFAGGHMSVDRQRDFYDGKSTEELRVLAERRGIPRYKTELFVGDSLREYLRAWDRDREDLERWFGVPQ